MKIAIIAVNRYGESIAELLKKDFENASIFKIQRGSGTETLSNIVGKIFNEYEGLIFIAALGIVVRIISPFIKDKFKDPAVVCVDTAGRFAISVLSGHEGGANWLSYLVARCLDALPIITTGKETRKKIIIGIGCRRGVSVNKVKKAILTALKEKNIELDQIRLAATIDLKKHEEGLIKATSELGLPLVFIPKESVDNFQGPVSSSEIVKRNIGLEGVCEPCALLAGRRTKLILKKKIINGVTVAIARES
ncbi:MAG: cobalamin biosynthesis protein [Candidatus Hydrogenedentota bacterium]